MGVAATATEVTMSAIQESLAQLGVTLGRIAESQQKMLVDLKKMTAEVTPTAATPMLVPGQIREQPTFKPSSLTLLSSVQVVGAGAPRADAFLAPTMPTSCSTFSLDVNVGSNHAAVRFPPCGNTEEVVLAPLEPSMDKLLQACDTMKFDMMRPATCSMQCYHEDTSLQNFVFERDASLSSSPTPLLLAGGVFSPKPYVTTVPVGFNIISTVTPHMVDGMVDEVVTDIGCLSLFAELELDSTKEVFTDSPLKDMVWDKELASYVVTHIGGSSLFLEHSLGAKQELEANVHTHLDRTGCEVGLVFLVEVKMLQPLPRERKHHDTNSPTILLPWDREKQEVVIQGLCCHLTHAQKGIMPTLPWDPGVCSSLPIVARNLQYMLVLIRNSDVVLNYTSLWPAEVKMDIYNIEVGNLSFSLCQMMTEALRAKHAYVMEDSLETLVDITLPRTALSKLHATKSDFLVWSSRHIHTLWNSGDVHNNTLCSTLTQSTACVGLGRPWDPGVITIHETVSYIILKRVRMPFGTGSTNTHCQISGLLRRSICKCCLHRQTVLQPDRAIAWGQAMFLGGGNVMTAHTYAMGRRLGPWASLARRRMGVSKHIH